ncbi:inositol monophosphatase family protein [Erysipelothrix sp. HDW6C]|uniref:inositol monophosphatase family protein n=1 Tax=Erysipelothrix sp. HDW6C TaxID=2714930 RepID=UPI00140A373D|nr:inositol monophosphatase family protein [Erysipelothrix sp. HDW6C]QIK70806.1 inositol monophosphatase family protein [Erysipelothrix sp. HDW6C]
MQSKVEFTVALVYEAAIKIREMMHDDIKIEQKTSKSDLVTNVDKQTEVFLVEGINGMYEHQNFLTEEKTVETHGLEDLWIIDPIDGTTNFIYQKKHFSISVAHYNLGKPVFGVVYDVMADNMYVGIVGDGAYLNGQKLAPLDQQQDLDTSVLTGDVYRPDLFRLTPAEMKPKFITHRFLGSGAIEICEVAAGNFQAYVFSKIKAWDIAAAVVLLECVGGTFYLGGQIDTLAMTNDAHVVIAASNPKVRDSLVACL